MGVLVAATPASNAELAGALRIAETDPRLATLAPALAEFLNGRLGQAAFVVPPATKKEAFIRLVAYIYDQPESPGGAQWANAWVNSGAASMVSPWLGHTAVPLGESPGGPAAGPGVAAGGVLSLISLALGHHAGNENAHHVPTLAVAAGGPVYRKAALIATQTILRAVTPGESTGVYASADISLDIAPGAPAGVERVVDGAFWWLQIPVRLPANINCIIAEFSDTPDGVPFLSAPRLWNDSFGRSAVVYDAAPKYAYFGMGTLSKTHNLLNLRGGAGHELPVGLTLKWYYGVIGGGGGGGGGDEAVALAAHVALPNAHHVPPAGGAAAAAAALAAHVALPNAHHVPPAGDAAALAAHAALPNAHHVPPAAGGAPVYTELGSFTGDGNSGYPALAADFAAAVVAKMRSGDRRFVVTFNADGSQYNIVPFELPLVHPAATATTYNVTAVPRVEIVTTTGVAGETGSLVFAVDASDGVNLGILRGGALAPVKATITVRVYGVSG